MSEISITYSLSEETADRLRKITEEHNRQYGLGLTEEKMFELIMKGGSSHEIDSKLEHYEWQLGLN